MYFATTAVRLLIKRGTLLSLPLLTALSMAPQPLLLALPLLLVSLLSPSRAAQNTASFGACFEKLWPKSAIYLQEHPAGLGTAVLASQKGLLTLVSLPPLGSNQSMQYVDTWLNLTGRVLYDGNERGLLSFAFHPNFTSNGLFYVAYNCDSNLHPDCQGPCLCNSDVNCTLGQRGASCNSNLVIGEYRTSHFPRNSNNTYPIAHATYLKPQERRRILTSGRPFGNHNGGHIFFGLDGFLYITSGDGGNEGDPFKFAQNPKTILGKVLRIDVNHHPKHSSIGYKVPGSNPFYGSLNGSIDTRIFALGLRNPWRCDQNRKTGLILCGDVGQDLVEEVDVLLSGANYQWSQMEGTLPVPPSAPIDNITAVGISTGPIFEYTHGCNWEPSIPMCLVDGPKLGLAVVGGVFYLSTANPCLTDLYVFSDYSGPMFVANASQPGVFQHLPFNCSTVSPLSCVLPSPGTFGVTYSFGKDMAGNAYVLASTGVYRITKAGNCGYVC